MIIGAILESHQNATGGGDGRNHNGAALMQFYTDADAVKWAISQSGITTYASGNITLHTLTTVINTDLDTKRWWYGGQEQTG